MNIVFRVDAALHIGSGHVMRCLTLADELTQQGATCLFICREFVGNLCSHIQQKGYVVHKLKSNSSSPMVSKESQRIVHEHWLGETWQEDSKQTISILSSLKLKIDWLIVDHYALDFLWETSIQKHVDKIMVIDDLADRKHQCDLLLDQNLGQTNEDYIELVPDFCQLFVGSNYALLRKEFAQQRNYSLERRAKIIEVKQILVTMGGVDPNNVTEKTLEMLKICSLPKDCNITVVMGEHAPHLESVRVAANNSPYKVKVLVNVLNIAELMANSDFAIGAAGSTSWERCCLGLPTLVIILAKNQQNAALIMHKNNIVISVLLDEFFEYNFIHGIAKIKNIDVLNAMSDNAEKIIDGYGCNRIAQEIMRT